jgi:hypothetical protein
MKAFRLLIFYVFAITGLYSCTLYKQLSKYDDGVLKGFELGRKDGLLSARVCMLTEFRNGGIVDWYADAAETDKPIQVTLPDWVDKTLERCQNAKEK